MASKWIKFEGGECPVVGDTPIDIRCRDGFEVSHSRADYPIWSHAGRASDIIAYRVQSCGR